MPLPRVRFTVRRMMVAVAIVGLGFAFYLWMDRRATRFQIEALAHASNSLMTANVNAEPPTPVHSPVCLYHLAMAKKYAWAASHPWLPVAPDPPEPE